MSATIRDRGPKGVYLRITTPGRKPQERYVSQAEADKAGLTILELAQRLKAEHEQVALDEKLWNSEDRPLPIDAMVRSWRDVHGATQSWRWQQTAEARVERLARHFGPRDLRSLAENDLRELAGTMLTQKFSGWTVAGHLSILRRVYRLAVDAGLFQPKSRLPFDQVIRDAKRRTQSEVSSRDAWTAAEVHTLLELAAPHAQLGPLLAFLVGTGCRRGEALALRWEDVDVARARVHFRRVPTGEKAGKTKAPKTGGRMTPLTGSLLALLQRLRGSRLPTDWVFPSTVGAAWEEHAMERAWARLRKRAIARGVRPLPLHCTRHTAISAWLSTGVPIKRVSEWVGASVATLERHYAHVLPMDSEVPDLLGAFPPLEVGETGGSERRKLVTRVGFEPTAPSFGGSSENPASIRYRK